jgi:hypothetical protein
MSPGVLFYLLPYFVLYFSLKDGLKTKKDSILSTNHGTWQILLALLGILEIFLFPIVLLMAGFMADTPAGHSSAMTSIYLAYAFQPLCWILFFWRVYIKRKVLKQRNL